jgi:hypothetical protein
MIDIVTREKERVGDLRTIVMTWMWIQASDHQEMLMTI